MGLQAEGHGRHGDDPAGMDGQVVPPRAFGVRWGGNVSARLLSRCVGNGAGLDLGSRLRGDALT
ncbi:hypothetical protein [Acidovorax sp. SDU_ACID1]|uniref:hypothetical protein n=1 Tax=Acidovorax sp. SDU_ACID1 TaxID=3136632 RepID=UPI003873C8E3